MILHAHEFTDLPCTDGGAMRTHVFRPVAEGRFPGVVLYSEIYQVTAPIRRLAAFIAGHGYVVAVPEVYHEYEAPGTVLAYDKDGTDRGNDLKFTKPVAGFDADARLVIDFLESHPACSGRIGVAGVCLGGHLAYRAAFDRRVLAAACFYPTDIHSATLGEGRSDDSLMRIGEIGADMLFVWGRQDPHVSYAGREAIRGALEAAGTVYGWHEVNAQHAFLRDEGPRYDPALFVMATGWMLGLFARVLGGRV